MRPLDRVPLASYSAPNVGGTYLIPAQGKHIVESAVMLRVYSYSLIPGSRNSRNTEPKGSRIPEFRKKKAGIPKHVIDTKSKDWVSENYAL